MHRFVFYNTKRKKKLPNHTQMRVLAENEIFKTILLM